MKIGDQMSTEKLKAGELVRFWNVKLASQLKIGFRKIWVK